MFLLGEVGLLAVHSGHLSRLDFLLRGLPKEDVVGCVRADFRESKNNRY